MLLINFAHTLTPGQCKNIEHLSGRALGCVIEVKTQFDHEQPLTERLVHQKALDALVGGWTHSLEAYEAMHSLQQAGVPAGVCQTAEDRCDHDPQLTALHWLTEVTGTKIGRWPVAEVAVKMSESPAYIGGRLDRGAPCYGEDNHYVYGELLGMSAQEIDALAEEGVI